MSALVLVTAATLLPPSAALAQSPAAPASSAAPLMDLDAALRRAIAADPARAGLEARLRAVEAGVRQAGVRPNPTLGLMVENLPTFGAGSFIDLTQTTLTYDQRLERGGDRPARSTLARSEGLLVVAEARVAMEASAHQDRTGIWAARRSRMMPCIASFSALARVKDWITATLPSASEAWAARPE